MTDSDERKPGLVLVTATSRPTRVALLLDERDPEALRLVDVFTTWATECWGGGYFPVITFRNGHISDGIFLLLDASDPAVIVFASETPADLEREVQDRVGAAQLVRAREAGDPDSLAGRLHSVQPVTGTLLLPPFIVARASSWPQIRFFYVRDQGDASASLRTFVSRNFGLVRETVSHKESFDAFPVRDVRDVGSTTVQGVLQAYLATGTRTFTPRDLAFEYATRPYRPGGSRGSADQFVLVVGESLGDVVLVA